ncbi:MAG: hypothetical protein JWL97_3738, partial [Gemmatimonadales bacterium]|nr:hypothetical protein [Gemmatimonadales bacterium]
GSAGHEGRLARDYLQVGAGRFRTCAGAGPRSLCWRTGGSPPAPGIGRREAPRGVPVQVGNRPAAPSDAPARPLPCRLRPSGGGPNVPLYAPADRLPCSSGTGTSVGVPGRAPCRRRVRPGFGPHLRRTESLHRDRGCRCCCPTLAGCCQLRTDYIPAFMTSRLALARLGLIEVATQNR